MEEKAPFSASRHVVSDLRLWGNKPSWEVDSHGKSLLLHKAPWSKGNRAEALLLASEYKNSIRNIQFDAVSVDSYNPDIKKTF